MIPVKAPTSTTTLADLLDELSVEVAVLREAAAEVATRQKNVDDLLARIAIERKS